MVGFGLVGSLFTYRLLADVIRLLVVWCRYLVVVLYFGPAALLQKVICFSFWTLQNPTKPKLVVALLVGLCRCSAVH